jgi:hypothetical protein
MSKFTLLFSSILFFIISCSKIDTSLTPDKIDLKGRWNVKFYLDNVEQTTLEPYFWTFDTDSTFTPSNKTIFTENGNVSWNLKSNKYKIIPFENYTKQSIDYELYAKSIGITENDCKNVFDINYYELRCTYATNKGFQIFEIPLGVKLFEENSIILFPMVANKSLEIRFSKK